LKHKKTGKYYVGSQYGKNSDPSKLWIKYFTSSKLVKKLILEDGEESFEIISIICRKDARVYEQRYLMKAYHLLGRAKFINLFLNRNLSPGILLTEEILKKANSAEKKKKCSNSAKKLLEEKRHNFQLKPANSYEHVRKKISERMKGNNYGSKRKITTELKKILSEKSKGNTNVRGTRWWTNGSINKRCIECPGEGFVLGTIKVNK